MDVLQQLDANLGVHLRRLQLRVSKQLLDDAHVGPVFEHVRGAGVAQQVAVARPAWVGFFDVLLDEVAEAVGAKPASVAGDEQGLFLGMDREQGAHAAEVAFDPGQRPLADGHDAFLVALAGDVQRPPLAVQVAQLQTDQLGAADAGGVKQLQHGAVTHAQGIGDARHGEDGGHLAFAEGVGWQSREKDARQTVLVSFPFLITLCPHEGHPSL